MKLLDALVEQRIAAAAARGEPGANRPLAIEEDAQVPVEVLVANEILKTAGFAQPPVEQLRALCGLDGQLADAFAGSRLGRITRSPQCQLRAKWLALSMAMESLRGDPLMVPQEYRRRIAERLADRPNDEEAPEAPDAGKSGSDKRLS
jgi:hypothetical protein